MRMRAGRCAPVRMRMHMYLPASARVWAMFFSGKVGKVGKALFFEIRFSNKNRPLARRFLAKIPCRRPANSGKARQGTEHDIAGQPRTIATSSDIDG